MSLIGNRLYFDIPKVAEKQKTCSPPLLVLLCLWFCFFFPFLHVLSAVVFHLSKFMELQALVAICQKKPHIKQIVWQAFYETTQQGVGDGSRLLKRHFPLLSLIQLSLTSKRQLILGISPCRPGITPSSAVLKA